jgi:hypothetical protein
MASPEESPSDLVEGAVDIDNEVGWREGICTYGSGGRQFDEGRGGDGLAGRVVEVGGVRLRRIAGEERPVAVAVQTDWPGQVFGLFNAELIAFFTIYVEGIVLTRR